MEILRMHYLLLNFAKDHGENMAERQLLQSIVFGYMFWTLFYGFGPMIWFFPMNMLEISGYELFALGVFAPIILAIPYILQLCQTTFGSLIVRFCMLAGILSFQAPTTILRLIVLIGGTAAGMVSFTADMSRPEHLFRKVNFWGLILGYFALVVSRAVYRTVTPAWSDHMSNLVVATVFFVAIVDSLLAPLTDHNIVIMSSSKTPASHTHKANWLLVGPALGSMFFLLQWIFGELSVPCRFVIGGLPIPGGPSPAPWAAVTLGALTLGLMLSAYHGLAVSRMWSLVAIVAFYVMYYVPGYQGFFGSTILAIYATSVWPVLLNLFTHAPPVRTSLLIGLTYLIEIFYSVWTVAYNFVPGGVYTREFTGALIAAVIGLISICIWWHRQSQLLIGPYHSGFARQLQGEKLPFRTVLRWLVLFSLVGTLAIGWRSSAWQPLHFDDDHYERPGHEVALSSNDSTVIMMWTYHFAYDNDAWPSLERTLELIKHIGADVIGLVETDASKPFMGSTDLAQWLAERLNYHVDFGPATKTHNWGSILLSRYPIISSAHHLLPSPEGELAPAISAVLQLDRVRKLAVVVTHMGNDRDDLDRKLQAQALANITRHYSLLQMPVVFLGYVTSKPGSRDYKHLLERGLMKDIDPSDKERFCEYILYENMVKLGFARISHGGLTDTEVQVARFRVETPDVKIKDNSVIELDANKVPVEHRFSPVFGDYFVGHFYGQQHHYHMSTPKYFRS